MTADAAPQAGGKTQVDFGALLKESGLAALVALGLSIFIVGIRTVTIPGGLGLEYRWSWVAMAVVAVFAGRFLLALRRETRTPAARATRDARMERIGAAVQKGAKIAGPVLVVFAIALPWMPFSNRYIVDIATLVVMYIMLGWGLNIVVGLAGWPCVRESIGTSAS